MNQEEIAVMFRKSELENRAQRNTAILRNHAALVKEPLTHADKIANQKALDTIKRSKEVYEKATAPRGYWKRVWWALKGGKW